MDESGADKGRCSLIMQPNDPARSWAGVAGRLSFQACFGTWPACACSSMSGPEMRRPMTAIVPKDIVAIPLAAFDPALN